MFFFVDFSIFNKLFNILVFYYFQNRIPESSPVVWKSSFLSQFWKNRIPEVGSRVSGGKRLILITYYQLRVYWKELISLLVRLMTSFEIYYKKLLTKKRINLFICSWLLSLFSWHWLLKSAKLECPEHAKHRSNSLDSDLD